MSSEAAPMALTPAATQEPTASTTENPGTAPAAASTRRSRKRRRVASDKEEDEEADHYGAGDPADDNWDTVTRMKQLKQAEADLRCPLCQGRSQFPFSYPCGKHYGCHACIVATLQQNVRGQYLEAQDHVDVHSRLQCPYCQNTSLSPSTIVRVKHPTGGQGDVAVYDGLQPAPPIVINTFYPETEDNKCPYCTFTATVGGVCRHLQTGGCQAVPVRCPFCKDTIALKNQGVLRAHLYQECTRLCCPHDSCRFVGTHAQLRLHALPHIRASSLKYNTIDIGRRLLGNPRVIAHVLNVGPPADAKSVVGAAAERSILLLDAMQQFSDQQRQIVTRYINQLAQLASNADPATLLLQTGCKRLCRAWSRTTNQLLALPPLHSLADSDDDDDSADDFML